MDKEKIIFRARGPVYTHFALVILLFYVIFWDLKSGIVQVISGGVLIILGEFIRIWCASYIGTCGRAMSLDVKRLRVSGPYSFVRNPIYIGNFIWSAGLAVLANFPYVTVLLGVFDNFIHIDYSLRGKIFGGYFWRRV